LTPFCTCLLAAMLAMAAGCQAETHAQLAEPAAENAPQSGLEVVPLRIRSASAVHDFQVEVAQTEQQQAKGLMFRKKVEPGRGMIFPFPNPRPASFWMKNTLVPLDMLFIRPNGTIAMIAAETIPLSLEPVGTGEAITAVLELAGGRAAELGIREGDKVSWPRD
jgi:uncharacterized membrane protein (UPF0127 family)